MSGSFFRIERRRVRTITALATIPGLTLLGETGIARAATPGSASPVPTTTSIAGAQLTGARAFGKPVTVKVHARGGSPTDGVVVISNATNGTVYCSLPIVMGKAAVPATCLPVGVQASLMASYLGGTSWAASASNPTAPFVVVPAAPTLGTVTITPASGPHVVLRFVASAKSAPGMPTPTGTIVFHVKGLPDSPPVPITADGTTREVEANFTPADYKVVGSYSGDDSFSAEQAVVHFKFNGADFNVAKNANNGEGWQFSA